MEIQSTGIAAIGGSARHSEKRAQPAFSGPLLAEVSKLEIATFTTMRVTHEVHSNFMGIKTPPAFHTSPRPQGCKANYSVDKPVATGTHTVLSFAGWTNHFWPTSGDLFGGSI
jgi:hypothetical protein